MTGAMSHAYPLRTGGFSPHIVSASPSALDARHGAPHALGHLMRYVYAPLVLALLAAAPAQAQWIPQSPTPTHLDIRGVGAPTASHVFVATEDDSFDDGGALFESTDGGATWTQRDVPENGFSPFNGMFFLDAQRGWAYGNENVRTTDGGATWQALPFLGSTYHMEFFTPTFGVASTGGDLSVSRDGGLTWAESPNGLYDFAFADAQTGLGVSARRPPSTSSLRPSPSRSSVTRSPARPTAA